MEDTQAGLLGMKRLCLLALLVVGCAKEEPVVSEPPPPREFKLKYGMPIKDKSWESKDGTTKIEISFDWDGVLWVLNIEEGPFDSSKHKSDGGELIDGKQWFGGDLYPPQTEIKSFTVSVGGKQIEVPKELYEDCYNLNLAARETSDFGVYGILVRGLPEGAMLLSSYGSDAAGSYLVHWWIGGSKPPERSITTKSRDMFEYMDYFNTMVPERPSEVSRED